MPSRYAIGWIKEPLEYQDHFVEIAPLGSFDEAVLAVTSRQDVFGTGWIHPPLADSPTEGLALPVGRFALPPTHYMEFAERGFDHEFGSFMALLFGFTQGLRVTSAGEGHLHATPWKIGTLVGFVPTGPEVLHVLARGAAHWDASNPEVRSLTVAAMHWHLTSQSYRHQWEEFSWQYSVLDNLHRLSNLKFPTYAARAAQNRLHRDRPINLGEHFNTPIPASFTIAGGEVAGCLVKARNALTHEARWLERPLGFAASDEASDLVLELKNFNAQIILGVLEVDCSYRQLEYCHGQAELGVQAA